MKKQFGLIGHPVKYSFSADYFNSKFRDEGFDAEYLLFDLEEIGRLPDLMQAHPQLKGLNVTSPYKEAVIDFLDVLSPEAASINAVNVIKIISGQDGTKKLHGFNSDWKGFKDTIKVFDLCDEKALIFGTGGAARAVKFALEKSGVETKLVSRNPSANQISYDEASSLIPQTRLIVNATPLGMKDKSELFPPVDYSLLNEKHICYDLIYNPPLTPFLLKAKKHNATIINGHDMLINQAEYAWRIWNQN